MWEGRGSTALALELRLPCINWPILYWVKFIELAAISSWVCASGSRLSDSRKRHQHQYAEPPTGHMSVIWPGLPIVCSFLKYTILTLPDCILYWLLKSATVAWTHLTHWGQACFSVLGHSLSHWGRVTHICVGNLAIIGSDNGLSPGRRQTIIWTNAGILLIGPLGTNFNETSIEIHTFSFKKIHLKLPSGKWRPFCLGLNVLSRFWLDVTMREAVNRATYTYWNHIYFCSSYVTFRDLVMLHIWDMVVCIMSTISFFVVVGNDKYCNTVVEHVT